jgi:hypothetical protein
MIKIIALLRVVALQRTLDQGVHPNNQKHLLLRFSALLIRVFIPTTKNICCCASVHS